MARRPTVYDVAERAGVSITTVSFAFRQPGRVKDATRQAVLDAARELGYAPSASARGLARGSTGAFGLYAFDMMLADGEAGAGVPAAPAPHAAPVAATGPVGEPDPRVFPLYVDEVERGFALGCRAAGRPLLLASGAPSGTAVADVAGSVDGLAIFPGTHSLDAVRGIAQSIPLVAFSTPGADPSFSHVSVDNRGAMAGVVEHLVGVHGVTDLAFVGEGSMYDFADRLTGFRDAVARLLPERTAVRPEHEVLATTAWVTALDEAVAADRLPRALVCQSDQTALHVLDLLAAHGVDVPGRVLVTGFDGILAGRMSTPTLTTVRQPFEDMGRTAVRLLADRLADPTSAAESRTLPTRLVPRGSCGCAEGTPATR
ncbi:LacI family DNA-binding transcriptional regulator [Cellulomonas triticagri]|uniref:LacI family transcriptional regulator n=1 Tax=Cellulomonas triticagri TaxID=2483352 RepID=A0A3M2JNB0_9CELL|nr:LacI family DNA-binding transcriptional regulator [Cellulomonas triticagri]RMI13791.1 LacI family transcriptional regulator [Cellulomonas triticagri]